MPNNYSLFGDISKEEFLRDYWHKKPLLVKNFYPNAEKLATIENLLEMSMDEHFESRLVQPPSKEKNWTVKEGPFEQSDFSENEWTLAVHGLDLYYEEFFKLKTDFEFIPSFQFDDIMATYSLPGTGLGAHIDNYDTFIFQGLGKRKWRLQTDPDPTYIENIDILILKNFNHDTEWILEPGDMIYVPPRVAHHGITLEESISYSIGYKAQDSQKVLNSYGMHFLANYQSDEYINHPAKLTVTSPHLIDDDHFKNMKDHMMQKFFEENIFKDWTLSYLTTPRKPIPQGEYLSKVEVIIQRIAQGEVLYKDPHVKFNYFTENGNIILYIATRKFLLTKTDYAELEKILILPSFVEVNLSSLLKNSQLMKIIKECIEYGIFYFDID